VKEYGKILVEHRPAETVEILLRLCTDLGDPTTRRGSNGMHLLMIPSPMDFVNIFVHSAQYLMEFLENYIKAVKDSPTQTEIHNTLLELFISNDLSFPSISQENGFENHNTKETNGKETANGYKSGTRDKANLGEDTKIAKNIVDRRRKGLALLKSAWTSEMQDPLYDVDLALILCNTHAFKDGLLFLYEKLKLYKEVISCYKQAHDHEGLIACCKKLGDSSQGGDPSLWGDLLKYFGELGEDCSKEVKEVLTYIEKEDVVPPIVVLQTLSKNPFLTLSVVKDYIARKLEQESKLIEDDRKSIDKYQVSNLLIYL